MFDFIVIGDVTTDHIVPITDENILNTIDRASGKITFPFPRKVPLGKPPETLAGGNAYTVSCALKKLGINVGIYTVIGNDVEGEGMKTSLQTKGVNVDLVQHDTEKGTNSSTILSAGGDRVIFTYHYRRDYLLPDLPETKFVYLTSIGEDDQPLFKQVLEQQQSKNFKLIFAPGSMQLHEEYNEIELLMQAADLIIVNKEEAQMLTKSDSNDDDTLLKMLNELGPKEVVITKSMQGSVGLSGDQVEHVGALKVETADTTGAGDTYAATFAAARLLGKDLRTSMEWGAINASNVVCQIGCEMGMLERAQVEAQHEISKDKLVFS